VSILSDILDHNASFVASRKYEAFLTDRFPTKRLAIVACMDTRLVELLPKAMNLRNGDVKMIKVAGAIVAHPFGSVMRSILTAVYQLGTEEIAVVGHHGCGMVNLSSKLILEKVREAGISEAVLRTLEHSGVDLERWLTGFARVEDGVLNSVEMIQSHPLLPQGFPVHGLIMDPETGKLDLLVDGYRSKVQ
jgi:carbonic anhydrase